MSILSSIEFQTRLSDSVTGSRKVEILSGYLTNPAVAWLSKLIPNSCKVSLVSSLTVADLISGASDLSAVEDAIVKGWSVFALPRLHAKVYLIDDSKVFVGSSNFTANGLKLYGTGNIEGTVELEATQSHLEFVLNILNQSVQVDLSTLKKMEAFLKCIDQVKMNNDQQDWPDDFFAKKKGLWVHDLFWYAPEDLFKADNSHDRELLSLVGQSATEISNCFKRTKVYSWLLRNLESSKDAELYFGELSAKLHSALLDDPGPYRRNVKEYLSELLAYCSIYASDNIIVDRPNYSQRVRLLN